MLACGGQNNGESSVYYSCTKFIDGNWETTHELLDAREWHSSWENQNGILLVGGGSSKNTTELLTDDGKSVESFGLGKAVKY